MASSALPRLGIRAHDSSPALSAGSRNPFCGAGPLASAYKKPVLTPEEETALFIIYKDPNKTEKQRRAAFDTLVERNIRLVQSIVSNMLLWKHSQSYTYEDLVGEGIIGLIVAIQRFDSTKGYKFSTYATVWIKQAIRRALESSDSIIHIPLFMQQRINELSKEINNFIQANNREPDVEDLAAALNWKPEQVEKVLSAMLMQKCPSLDEPLVSGSDNPSTLADFIQDTGDGPEEQVLRSYSIYEIRFILELMSNQDRAAERKRLGIPSLTTREFQVLKFRFNLDGEGKLNSLNEIGGKLNISRERARQILEKAIRKLKSVIQIAINNK